MATTFPGHALHEQDSEYEAGPSDSRPSKHGKARSQSCKQPEKSSKAFKHEAQRRHADAIRQGIAPGLQQRAVSVVSDLSRAMFIIKDLRGWEIPSHSMIQTAQLLLPARPLCQGRRCSMT